MKCAICSRESEGTFCRRHEKSYENLQSAFIKWRNAMDISWKQFLEEVKGNSSAGVWVKEVVSYILQKKE